MWDEGRTAASLFCLLFPLRPLLGTCSSPVWEGFLSERRGGLLVCGTRAKREAGLDFMVHYCHLEILNHFWNRGWCFIWVRISCFTRTLLLLLLLLSHFSRAWLWDTIEDSPSGSSVPGILQARILEWVAISFSNACMHAKSLQSCPTLCEPMDSSPPGSSVHGIL